MNRYLHLPDVSEMSLEEGFGEPWDVDVAIEELRRWCFACYNTGWVDGKTGSLACPFCDPSTDDAV